MLKKISYIFTGREKRYLVFMLFMSIIGGVLELLGVTAFMPFINVIMYPQTIQTNPLLKSFYDLFGFTESKMFLIFLAAVIIAIYVLKNAFLIYQKNAIYKFSFNVQKNLSVKLLDAYMKEPYTFHLNKNIAEMQRSLQEDVSLFAQLLMMAMELVVEMVVCVLIGVYLIFVSKTITFAVVGLMAVCVLGFAKATKKVALSYGKDCQVYKGKLNQWTNQSLNGIKEIKILGREAYFLDSYGTNYEKYTHGLCVLRLVHMVPKNIVEAVCMTGLLIAIIVKLVWGEADVIHFIPQLTVFAVAAFRLMPSVGKINGCVSTIVSAFPSVDLIYNDLKEVEEYERAMGEEDIYEWDLQDKISIKDVSYHYPDAQELVLDHVNFDIIKGKTVAFIGSSGAGKTTMVDVILGLLTPCSGTVMADAIDVHKNPEKWHKKIGYIPQSIYLADDSIRNNIAFGVFEDEIDDNEIIRALKQAQLDEFVATLPEGLNTFVGDRGIRLSGGQRQRIGIARALYHNPEVLVLDEATSALDTETEVAVMEAIESLQGMKTMLIIAHRLSTIKNADVIYEVVDGKVVERKKDEIFDKKNS